MSATYKRMIKFGLCFIVLVVGYTTIVASVFAEDNIPDHARVQSLIEDDVDVAAILTVEPYDEGFLVFFEAEEIDEMALAPPPTSHIGVGFLVLDEDDVQWYHGSVYRDEEERPVHAHFVNDPYEQAPFPMLFGHVHDDTINEMEVISREGSSYAVTILDTDENERVWYVANVEPGNDEWYIEARHDNELVYETTVNPRNVYYYFLQYWSVLQVISFLLFIGFVIVCFAFVIRWLRHRKNNGR